jgi:hypothetical protein
MEKPEHDLTIQDVFRIFSRDRHEAGRLLSTPQMSGAWKGWAQKNPSEDRHGLNPRRHRLSRDSRGE